MNSRKLLLPTGVLESQLRPATEGMPANDTSLKWLQVYSFHSEALSYIPGRFLFQVKCLKQNYIIIYLKGIFCC